MKTTGKLRIIGFLVAGFIILISTACNVINEPVFGGTVKDADGNVYHTVTIGNQTWMIENLKTTRFNDSTLIPLVTDSAAWINLKTPGYCWYNNDSTTFNGTYGTLYNWFAVNTGMLAPKGWHVATEAEWTTLESNVSQFMTLSGSLPKILASTSNWKGSIGSSTPGNNSKINNSSGFSAQPGGTRSNTIFSFNEVGYKGAWWSSTKNDSISARSLSISYKLNTVDWGKSQMQYGFSVRCIKDSN